VASTAGVRKLRFAASFIAVILFCAHPTRALAESGPDLIEAAPTAHDQRILGIIPNYQTVSDPNARYVPLTARQKWSLLLRETMDPFNVAGAALGSAFSQMGNETPKYGQGGAAMAMRFGAAWADLSTQNVFSTGILACLLHQDPRYFRKGPGAKPLTRIGYALSRIVATRNDAGERAFNTSGLGGMALGIAASNLYYPSASVHGSVMLGRLTTSLTGSVTGNLMSEFWPDIQRTFFHHKKTY